MEEDKYIKNNTEPSKKKSSLGIIIIIVFLLALGCFAISFFGNGSKKDEPKQKEEKKVITDRDKLSAIKNDGTELDINSDEVQKLYKAVTYGDIESNVEETELWYIKDNDIIVANELKDEEKNKAIAHLIDENEYKEVDCNGLNIPEKSGILMNDCEYAKEVTGKTSGVKQKYLTKDYVLGLYASIFGPSANMNIQFPISLSSNGNIELKYIEEYDNFYLYAIDGGGYIGGYTISCYKIKKAYTYDDYLIIDRDRTNKLAVEESSIPEEDKAMVKKELNKTTNLKYVFVKDGESYKWFGLVSKTK